MTPNLCYVRSPLIIALLVATGAFIPQPAAAQPGQNDPPATYEIQIDGESFQVESGQPPVKVESKLKKGTTYTLGVRVSRTQVLRLNSVRMEYGMWSKVKDDNGKDIRVALITNVDLGFTLSVFDLGHALDAKAADTVLQTQVDAAVRRCGNLKATDIKKAAPVAGKLGISDGKWVTITYKNGQGEACTDKVFILSGEKYSVIAEIDYRDQQAADVKPWVVNALSSIRPLH